jgi:transcriptional regulator
MYIPQHFAVTDRAEMLEFIKAHAFGQLTSTVAGRLFGTHLPFLVSDDQQSLFGHLARLNPQWEGIAGQEVLVTFQGAHDYISPSWYGAPGVPTWNYQAVHLYGRCQVLSAPEQLRTIVDQLSRVYESAFEKPWVPAYPEAMLTAIVGLKIDITELQGKYKLSQNRSRPDREQVAAQLETGGSAQLSQAMKHVE